MQEQILNESMKAVVIQVSDLFYSLGVDELVEGFPEDREIEAYTNLIMEVIQKARAEGYKKYLLMNSEEAKKRGQDLGINGVYLLVFKR